MRRPLAKWILPLLLISAVPAKEGAIGQAHVKQGAGSVEETVAPEPTKRVEVGSVSASPATAPQGRGDPQAIDSLVKALTDANASVCEAAADALGEIGGPRAVEGLMDALGNKWWFVRACGIRGLAKIGDQQALEAIAQSLRDRHEFVRTEAVIALSRMNWSPRTEDDTTAYLIAREAWDELVGIGAAATASIWPMLEDDSTRVRERAAVTLDRLGWQPQTDAEKVTYLMASNDKEELLKMGSRATNALLEELRSEHHWARESAARLLGAIGDPEARPALVHALSDERDSVSEAAARALDELNWQPGTDAEKVAYSLAQQDWPTLVSIGKPAVPALISKLAEVNASRAQAAASALGQIGDTQAVQALIEALEKKASHCRMAAAAALGEIGDERAIGSLLNVLRDDSDDLRYAAATALGEIGSPAFDLLTQALQDNDPRVRESAARALGTMRDKRAVAGLIQALTASHADVRRVSTWALGAIGDRSTALPLALMLRDADDAVRRSAASALQIVDKRSYDRWMARQKARRYAAPSVAFVIVALVWTILYVPRKRSIAPHPADR